MTVAIPTPATPMWKMITRIIFNPAFTTPEIIKNISGRFVSPTALKMAAP